MNFTTVVDGVLRDYSGGHIAQQDAEALIEALAGAFGTDEVRFHAGVSYRNLLVLSGARFSEKVKTEKPDAHQGDRVEDNLLVAEEGAAEETVAVLRQLVQDAVSVLENHPVNGRLKSEGKPQVNGIWPWSGGRGLAIKRLDEKFGISGAVISAVDVIVGLGRCLGMTEVEVPGVTGYIDTNYEGKADAAVEAIKTHDLVYLHVEAIDEVSHAQELDLKIKTIEEFDSRVVSRVISKVGQEVDLVVLPDHPVPVSIGKHTRTPVPIAARMSGMKPDGVSVFDEQACQAGSLGHMKGAQLMQLLLCRQ